MLPVSFCLREWTMRQEKETHYFWDTGLKASQEINNYLNIRWSDQDHHCEYQF